MPDLYWLTVCALHWSNKLLRLLTLAYPATLKALWSVFNLAFFYLVWPNSWCTTNIHWLHDLPTKVYIVKAMVFPVVMYGCESWTIKKAEHWRTDAFKLWCWRRLLRVPWTARRSNQSILKEINPEYSREGLMLKLKLSSFGHLMQSQLTGIDPDAGKDWRQEKKGMAEDEMVR